LNLMVDFHGKKLDLLLQAEAFTEEEMAVTQM
jgi:hypothetical protein